MSLMTTDLPKRPEPDPEDQSQIVDPTERVKSAGDKLDPRFEAARQKAEREHELRAKAKKNAGAKRAPEQDDVAPTDEPVNGQAGGGFSFNMTARDAEKDA